MKMGEKIRKLRKAKKWSQAELAEKAGVHTTYMNRLEGGKSNPSAEVIKKLGALLGVTADYLLYETIEEEESARPENRIILEKVKLLEYLEEEDRQVIYKVIDSFTTKQQVWNALHKDPDSPVLRETV